MDQTKVKQTVRRMIEARALLVRDYPFFGHLSMGLQLACAPCETACTDGSRLIFDPEFAEKLSERELQFVILHEVMHCVLKHCIRGKNLHSLLYNIACDIVVNSTILDMWGLNGDGGNGFGIGNGKDFGSGRGKNGKDSKVLDKIGYAGTLDRENSIRGGAVSREKSIPGTGVPEDIHETDEENRQADVPDISFFDRHDLWQGICDKTQLGDDWNGRIRNAIKECGNFTGMPQSIRKVVQELAERTGLDWKQLLHDFLQFDQYDYTFVSPDRRYAEADVYLPAFNVDEDDGSANDIWVCVDTSASISEEELACAMTEILDAMRQVRLKGKVSFFDSNITEPKPFETETELKVITPSGGGGTSLQIIFDYLQERIYPELPKAILVFTDGYAWWPEEKDALEVPVLWLISKVGKDDAPWGHVARL